MIYWIIFYNWCTFLLTTSTIRFPNIWDILLNIFKKIPFGTNFFFVGLKKLTGSFVLQFYSSLFVGYPYKDPETLVSGGKTRPWSSPATLAQTRPPCLPTTSCCVLIPPLASDPPTIQTIFFFLFINHKNMCI